MTNRRFAVVLWTVAFAIAGTALAAEQNGNAVVLSTARYQVAISKDNGSILSVLPKGGTTSILASGPRGLWEAKLEQNRVLGAADYSAESKERSFRVAADRDNHAKLVYRGPEIDVTIDVAAEEKHIEIAATVRPIKAVLLEFGLPASLRFDPEEVTRVVCPADGNQSVGTAFLGSFFKTQADPTRWASHSCGPKGYVAVYGDHLAMREVNDPPVALRVTDEGRKWLGPAVAALAAGSQAVVNRAPKPNQADLVLVDSEHGAYLSAKQFALKVDAAGRLWRLGGGVWPKEERIAVALVKAVIERLAEGRPASREKIGVIALRNGPTAGSWASVPVREWTRQLRAVAAASSGRVKLIELTTVRQMNGAIAASDFLAIVNPYGEDMPVEREGELEKTVRAIEGYARAGGNWFEVGGHPFFCELRPAGHTYQYGVEYPPAFADFFHIETRSGSAAVFRAAPRNWKPWQGATDRQAIFVPGRIACGGDDKGGFFERPFATYVRPNEPWRCPPVRLLLGASAQEALRRYSQDNGISRRLEEKVKPDVLRKLKDAVLVYYGGTCREKLEHLDRLPVPSLLHFAEYLHGGFDKQYPDHLPPRPEFGSPEEFREFFDRAHRLGHLMMPYTNPTWWCDEPRGPTFHEHGDAPLLKTLDGKVLHERYADNTGFTVCHWHPAVQAANRRTREQFLKEYPSDVLLQDQCGARTWRYDLNPASPTPHAYVEGLLSMIDEDSPIIPLSTESGWDRVVNAESQLCGMSWSLVPTEHAPDWRQLMKHRYDPATWQVFPVAQYIAHDKTILVHHDLGQFVTNRQVLAWTLGLGYAMSYRVAPPSLKEDRHVHWLRWLDQLQKSVCARYVGQPLDRFEHVRGDSASSEDDGLIRAQYGELTLVVNLDAKPCLADGRRLAAYGFQVTAPGLIAGSFITDEGDVEGTGFIAEASRERSDLWVYGPPGKEAAVLFPGTTPGLRKLVFDYGREVTTTMLDAHRFQLPAAAREPVGPQSSKAAQPSLLWHAVVR